MPFLCVFFFDFLRALGLCAYLQGGLVFMGCMVGIYRTSCGGLVVEFWTGVMSIVITRRLIIVYI